MSASPARLPTPGGPSLSPTSVRLAAFGTLRSASASPRSPPPATSSAVPMGTDSPPGDCFPVPLPDRSTARGNGNRELHQEACTRGHQRACSRSLNEFDGLVGAFDDLEFVLDND